MHIRDWPSDERPREKLLHRGATGADPDTGDGAGLLIQMPDGFFREEAQRLGFALPEAGKYAVVHADLVAGLAPREIAVDFLHRCGADGIISTRQSFIRRAKERRRDYTVDWVHLKLNDQAQRTVLCKDPFRSVDERVERLIAGM